MTSQCSGCLSLENSCIRRIVPWFFALGHTNYARWIPVHLSDMVALEDKHPDVFAEFMAGNFTVKKTTHAFAALAIDQAHEQNNASVKGDGGAVGLTDNPAALRRWMVSGPAMSRVIAEFQATADTRTQKTDFRHHEQTKHTQLAFARDVKSLSGVMREMGNPLLWWQQWSPGTRQQGPGRPSCHQHTNLPLFSQSPVREKSRTQLQVSSLKNDCSLFSRFFIASQCVMEISTTSLLMRTRHVRMPCHRWAKWDWGAKSLTSWDV